MSKSDFQICALHYLTYILETTSFPPDIAPVTPPNIGILNITIENLKKKK